MARRPGRGWGALVALALAAMTFWVSGDPLALIGLPLALVLLALPPRRVPQLILMALALLLAVAGPSGDAIWQFDRGWALLLGAWFVVVLLTYKRASFTARALLATGATAVTAALVMVFRPGSFAALDSQLAAQLRAAVAQQVQLWKSAGAELPPAFAEGMYRVVQTRSYVGPALAGLASMAALALAWGIYRRTVVRDEPALPPLRQFRFRDELVWLLVAGLVLVLIPGLGPGAVRAGSNLLTFMGALYALRGVAVVVSMSSGAFAVGGVLLLLFAALADSWLPAMVMGAAVLVGLTDTWLDLRARLTAPPSPGK